PPGHRKWALGTRSLKLEENDQEMVLVVSNRMQSAVGSLRGCGSFHAGVQLVICSSSRADWEVPDVAIAIQRTSRTPARRQGPEVALPRLAGRDQPRDCSADPWPGAPTVPHPHRP